MKICVFGAGGVGGYMAARLIASGQNEVSILARGAHLAAIQSHGIQLLTPEEELRVHPAAAVSSASELPQQDLVFVTLKTISYAGNAAPVRELLAPGGHAVFVSNGIPWWWNFGLPGRDGPMHLLDPGGELWHVLTPQRVLGCVIYSVNEVIEPGVVRHSVNNRWVVGEPDNSASSRLTATAHLMNAADLHTEVSSDLRWHVWAKLLRNSALNSICALTRLSIAGLARESGVLELVYAVIDEIVAIATAQGFDVREYVTAAREAPARGGAVGGQKVGNLKPSMLQDVLAGRDMEIEAILGQPQAFAREVGVASSTIDVILPLLRGLTRSLRSGR